MDKLKDLFLKFALLSVGLLVFLIIAGIVFVLGALVYLGYRWD